MTALQSQTLDRIEADRKKRERELLILLLLITDDARQHMQHAVRLGVDAATALHDVIVGNAALDQPGLADAMAERMLEAYQSGVRRVMRLAGLNPDLSISPLEQEEQVVRSAYNTYAVTATQSLYQRIADKVTTALQESIGESINKRVRLIRVAMTRAGFTRMNPSQLEAFAEASVLRGHNDGMFSGYFNRAVAPRIVGFRHISVLDNHTTTICDERAELTLRRDNPYWQTNWPALHSGCRSAVVPIFRGQPFEESGWLPLEPPMAGFGAAPAWVSAVAA
jgi:hypothetical protein